MADTLLFHIGGDGPPAPIVPAIPDAPADSPMEHTSYLFADYDGIVNNEEIKFISAWDSSAYVTFNSNLVAQSQYDEGINITHSNVLQVPIAGSPGNATGTYRTRLHVNSQTYNTPGTTPGIDFCRGKIEMFTNDSHHFENDTYYTYSEQSPLGSGTTAYPRHVMYAQEWATYSFSEIDGRSYYYTGDNEDVYMNFQIYSYAGNTSPAYTRTELISAVLYNEAEYNAGGGDWTGCRDAATGYLAYNTSTTNSYSMTSAYEQFASPSYNNKFAIWRSFFSFDFGNFSTLASGTRDLISSTLSVAGASYSDSSVVAQIGTQADSLTSADFDAFTGGPASDVVAWEHSGNAFNVFTFNTTGSGYIDTQMASNSQAKFCLREYDHDYLDVAPSKEGGTDKWQNGCVFSEHESNLTPKFIVTYNKLSDYTDARVEDNWSILAGSWNGSCWESTVGGDLTLRASGSWKDDERWSGMRLTFSGTSSLDLSVYTNGADLLVDNETINSNDTVTLHWKIGTGVFNGNFQKFELTSGGDPYTLYRIDLLER